MSSSGKKKVLRMSASYDRQVNIFLVNYCIEQEGLSITSSAVYHAYFKVNSLIDRRAGNEGYYDTKLMSKEGFIKRLVQAGFSSTVADVGKSQKEAVIQGLAVDYDKIHAAQREKERKEQGMRVHREDLRKTMEFPRSNPQVIQPHHPQPVYQRSPEVAPVMSQANPQVAGAIVAAPTGHVLVGGGLVACELIATVTKIKGFTSFGGREIKYHMTFHNPQMKHQWLTQAEGDVVLAKLGGS